MAVCGLPISTNSSVLQDTKTRGDVRSGEFPTVTPGAALESFQRLLEEFADALTTTKRDQQRTAVAVHTGVQTIGARGKASMDRQGSGVCPFMGVSSSGFRVSTLGTVRYVHG